jgi:transposase
MSRLVTLCEYKADWRGREVIKVDPCFASSQLCCMCGVRHRETRKLSVRTLACDNVMGRDRNAAVNIYEWYPEERENRDRKVSTRMEMGDQELAPVPVSEMRISTYEKQ